MKKKKNIGYNKKVKPVLIKYFRWLTSIKNTKSKIVTWIELINKIVNKKDSQSLIKFGVKVIFLM